MNGWMDFSDPLDDTLTYNASGLVEMMATKGGSVWGGYLTPWDKFVFGVEVGQRYLMENTTLGIPALVQSEGLCYLINVCSDELMLREFIINYRSSRIYEQWHYIPFSNRPSCVIQSGPCFSRFFRYSRRGRGSWYQPHIRPCA